MTHKRAFTLVEMLLVLIITAVMVALAVPNFAKGYGSFQLRQVADDLKNKARWAQAMAMGQQRIYRLTFTDDRHCYAVTRIKNEGVKEELVFERVRGSVGKDHCLPDQTTLTVDKEFIQFYPDGTLEPVDIALVNGAHKLILSSKAKRGALLVFSEE